MIKSVNNQSDFCSLIRNLFLFRFHWSYLGFTGIMRWEFMFSTWGKFSHFSPRWLLLPLPSSLLLQVWADNNHTFSFYSLYLSVPLCSPSSGSCLQVGFSSSFPYWALLYQLSFSGLPISNVIYFLHLTAIFSYLVYINSLSSLSQKANIFLCVVNVLKFCSFHPQSHLCLLPNRRCCFRFCRIPAHFLVHVVTSNVRWNFISNSIWSSYKVCSYRGCLHLLLTSSRGHYPSRPTFN